MGIEALGIMPLGDDQVLRGMGLIIPHMLTWTEEWAHYHHTECNSQEESALTLRRVVTLSRDRLQDG